MTFSTRIRECPLRHGREFRVVNTSLLSNRRYEVRSAGAHGRMVVGTIQTAVLSGEASFFDRHRRLVFVLASDIVDWVLRDADGAEFARMRRGSMWRFRLSWDVRCGDSNAILMQLREPSRAMRALRIATAPWARYFDPLPMRLALLDAAGRTVGTINRGAARIRDRYDVTLNEESTIDARIPLALVVALDYLDER
jgi:hypothetical protein